MRTTTFLWLIGCVAWLGAGCGGSEQTDTPPSAALEPVADELSLEAEESDLPPPLTDVPVIDIGTPDAPMEQQIRTVLTPTALTYFRNDDGDLIVPKSTVELLQRAVYTYSELQEESQETARPWPRLTDLAQLVQFRVLTALPAPPPGQKFVYDPKTRRVSVAAQ
jgi:hypothetical protein